MMIPVPDTVVAATPRTTIAAHNSAAVSTPPTGLDFPSVVGPADVAIFWDFENVRIPAWCPVTTASESIRSKLAKYGRIVEKRLYYDSRQATEQSAPRSDLDLSGFTLVDCPSRGRKETLDKKLIVDVLCFAWERASLGAKMACVVLITSDGDYSYALARLRDIGVFTVVIYRPDIVAKVLIDNANVVMSWEFDILGGPPDSHGDDDEYDEEVEDMEQQEGETSADGMMNVNGVNATNTQPVCATEEEDNKKDEQDQASLVVEQPNLRARGKFAIFCSVVLNAQHRNVHEGISVYSSWAAEGALAVGFYEKIGGKDRDVYLKIRTLASEKSFIEWGRRKLSAPGKPVVKVKNRDDRSEDLSLETYLRLTYLGLSMVKPNIAARESGWTTILPRGTYYTQSSNLSSESSFTKRPNSKLFVGGLAWETTADSLRSYFRQFGPLDTVLVKEGRGFGLVFFRNSNDAEAVLKNAGHHIVDNKSVDVKPYIRNS